MNSPLLTDLSTDSAFATFKTARMRLLEMHKRANSGHIGGNFSCVDALLTLYHSVMKPSDRFILSKGHSAGALYIALWSTGQLSDAEIDSFCKDNTSLPGHPSGSGIPGLLFSTGSLGHGPSLAAGLAMSSRFRTDGRKIYCLCSDGEWQEGTCWEALVFAVHWKLDNLTILIDQNGLQGFGTTEEVISCSDLAPRISGFGAHVITVDGHDPVAIKDALETRVSGKPVVVLLKTIKGRGLHFEGRLESHYLPLSEDDYAYAREHINGEVRQ